MACSAYRRARELPQPFRAAQTSNHLAPLVSVGPSTSLPSRRFWSCCSGGSSLCCVGGDQIAVQLPNVEPNPWTSHQSRPAYALACQTCGARQPAAEDCWWCPRRPPCRDGRAMCIPAQRIAAAGSPFAWTPTACIAAAMPFANHNPTAADTVTQLLTIM